MLRYHHVFFVVDYQKGLREMDFLLSKHEEIDRLLRLKDVLKIVPVSKSTWWAWCAQGVAPAAIKLSERTTCWRLSDVIAFIEKAHKNGGVK